MTTKLRELFEKQGQSPWLDNLTRKHVTSGELKRLVEGGIRGVTSNPTIFAKAISDSPDYDEQFLSLVDAGVSVTDAYWAMVIEDVQQALSIVRPIYDESEGPDGFVSIELAPALARDTVASIRAARGLHERIEAPNLFVKIPATPEGVPAIRQMIAEGHNINITLIFSLERYDQVIEAYLTGLETFRGDLSSIHSVASFFVSRVDTEVDGRLEAIGSAEALALRGQAATSQAKAAYRLFRSRFSGPRWDALAARGARVQRPLWASTSTKNPAYSDTLYVDRLIGPDTINTMPEATIAAFEDHGTLARTVDEGAGNAERLLQKLDAIGVSMTDVGLTLEEGGRRTFTKSFDDLIQTLELKRAELSRNESGSHA
jgi:transaldolase